MKKIVSIGIPALLFLLASSAWAGNLVQEFKGSRSARTAVFEVDAPWLIDWRVNSDYQEDMGIVIDLVNAEGDLYAGRVVKTKQPGDGLRLMNEGGRYYFKVDASVANWTIRVIQLNKGEEELYKPKKRGLIDEF